MMTQTSKHTPTVVDILRRHFEPTLEMLHRAIQQCPDEVWAAENEGAAFWQQAYHAIFWLDYWFGDPSQEFKAPSKAPSFHTNEAVNLVKGASPTITREEIERYCEQVYERWAQFFDDLSSDKVVQESEYSGKMWTIGDRLLAQIRHVQHHVGYMNCMLRRQIGSAPGWVGFSE